MAIADRYADGSYHSANPDWHVADSPWKAAQVLEMLRGVTISTICEVGCGAGEILRSLHDQMPATQRLVGYEISSDALQLAERRATDRLTFVLGDAAKDREVFDLMLIMDVIEHVGDPIDFLSSLRFKAKRTILHVPLDLSVQSILRARKLISLRQQVGHIHYFTPETAIATVQDAGYTVTDHVFTRVFDRADRPPQSVKTRIAGYPRRLLPRSLTIRVLGGYSLLIDASNDW